MTADTPNFTTARDPTRAYDVTDAQRQAALASEACMQTIETMQTRLARGVVRTVSFTRRASLAVGAAARWHIFKPGAGL